MNNNELVVLDDFSKQLQELQTIQSTCAKLLQTKHYATMGEAGIHAIIARSKSLGLHPFEALNGLFFCINGKVGMSTETMAALIRRRGHSITKDPKSTNECVILHGKRADNGDTWTCTFSKDDAITAGLWNGPTWKKYPAVMLYNRCMSMLFRQLFPDLSLGAGYVEDELKEITKTGDYQKELPVAEVEVKSPKVTRVEISTPLSIDNALITQDQAEQIMKRLEKYSESTRDSVWKWFESKGISSFEEITQDLLIKLNKKLDETDNAKAA